MANRRRKPAPARSVPQQDAPVQRLPQGVVAVGAIAAVLGPWLLLGGALLYVAATVPVGWNQPITDAHAFRQTQTALSAYWLRDAPGPFWRYETPVLGPPWQIPFELPVYQVCVADVSSLLHVPLDQAGRLVSLAFFLLTLLPLNALLARLDVARPQRLLVLSLVLLNPFYLFWSRCVLIETTALCFGMAFLAAATAYIQQPAGWRLAACMGWGALAGMTKITTFVPFALGALLVGCWWIARSRPPRSVCLRRAAGIIAALAVALAASVAWTRYADAVKAQNPLGRLLTSQALAFWNFDTLQYRLDLRFWYAFVLRPVTEAQYHPLLLLGSVAAAACTPRRWTLIAGCVALFLSAPLVFTGLHEHSYYACANLIFLLVALGLIVAGLLESAGWRKLVGVALLAALLATGVERHQSLYLPLQQSGDNWPVRLGELVRRYTTPGEAIVIYGDDWSPEIPYYAQRRALMLPGWANDEAARQAIAALDGSPVGAMIVIGPSAGPGWRPASAEELVRQRTRWKLGQTARLHSDRACDVYVSARWDNVVSDYRAAEQALAQRRTDEALAALDRALTQIPDDPELHIERARCHQLRKEWDAMIADSTRAAELSPADPATWYAHATMLLVASAAGTAGSPPENILATALAAADHAVELAPRNPQLYVLRGRILALLGRGDDADREGARAQRLAAPRRHLDNCARLVIAPPATRAAK